MTEVRQALTRYPMTYPPNDPVFWLGSNGNTFTDYNGFRYCIHKRTNAGYNIARDGNDIAVAPSMADAKLYIKREG